MPRAWLNVASAGFTMLRKPQRLVPLPFQFQVLVFCRQSFQPGLFVLEDVDEEPQLPFEPVCPYPLCPLAPLFPLYDCVACAVLLEYPFFRKPSPCGLALATAP